MDKHAKTGQELSEELLQQITGGSGNNNIRELEKRRDEHAYWYARYSWLVEADAARGARGELMQSKDDAAEHKRMIEVYQKQIDAAKGNASSSESPAKRPRL